MAEEFLFDSIDPAAEKSAESGRRAGREPVRLIAIGSREGVMEVIYNLHDRGFAQTSEWSALQLEPTTGKLMSVVTKYFWIH